MAGRRRQDFQSLKSQLIRQGKLFVDEDFPATTRSVYPRGVPSGTPTITWARPSELATDPKFIIEGATRYDLNQGQLGDCWFVAACSSLIVSSRKLFERVCPSDQSFESDSYAGIFRFNFWRYGKWTEVIIDDRLPTHTTFGLFGREKKLLFASNNKQQNEFWVALVEKAYAKLNGSYQGIDGGHIQNALIDMTGGISETFDLTKPSDLPAYFFQLIQRTLAMHSMIGVSIPVFTNGTGPTEVKRSNGLHTGHAYSITGITEVTVGDQKEALVRLRNPWGEGEWNGRWSDRSREWKGLSEQDRRNIGLVVKEDGEFWMPFDDMVREFDQLGMCHLTPDSLTKEVATDLELESWIVSTYHGEWVYGVSAGGSGNIPHQDLYFTNPQYRLEVMNPDSDENDGLCTIICSLMEKENKTTDKEALAIGLDAFQLRPEAPSSLLDAKNLDLRAMKVIKRTSTFVHERQVCYRLRVNPGRYIFVPSTFQPMKEADFLMRIYTQKEAPSELVDSSTGPIIEEERPTPKKDLQFVFNKYAASDSVLDAEELSEVLNDYYAEDISGSGFSIEAARNVIPMSDRDSSGTISFSELDKVVKEMDAWKTCFNKADRDESGSIDTKELRSLLDTIGFSLSKKALGSAVRRYGGKNKQINFQDFIVCMCRIMVMYGVFREHVSDGEDGEEKAEFTLEEWMYTALYY